MKKKYEKSDNKKVPFITVRIPIKNKLTTLKYVKKCLKFDYPKNRYEIIIDNDNIGHKAGNLNHMLKHSKGDIIVLFDSDFVPPKNFLRKIIEPEKEQTGH